MSLDLLRTRDLAAIALGTAALAGCLGPGSPTYDRLDPNPPRLVKTVPPAGAEAVNPKLMFLATFDEPLDARTLLPAFQLLDADGKSQDICLFRPKDAEAGPGKEYVVVLMSGTPAGAECAESELARGAAYTVRVLKTLTDRAGNALAEEQDVRFTTAR